jgi:hypothetical protein
MERENDYIMISFKDRHIVKPYHPATPEIGKKVYAALLAHNWLCMWGSEFVQGLRISYDASLQAEMLPVD